MSALSDAWPGGAVECSDHIECVLLSRDERLVCLASAGGEIVVVELESGRVAGRLPGHAGSTSALALTPDGRLVSAGQDSFVRCYSLETLAEVGCLRIDAVGAINGPAGAWVSALACDAREATIGAAAGSTIVVAPLDAGAFGSVEGLAPAGSVCVIGPLVRAVDCLAFLPDGTLCACGYGGVLMFRPRAPTDDDGGGGGGCAHYEPVARLAKTYHSGVEGATLGYKGWLLSLAPSPSGEWVACGCSDSTVRLWRTSNGQDFKCGGYSSKVTAVVWQPGGRLCATSGSNQVRARARARAARGRAAAEPPANCARATLRRAARRELTPRIPPLILRTRAAGDAVGFRERQPGGHDALGVRRPEGRRQRSRLPPRR